MEKKTSDSQLKATRNWEKRNREQARYASYKRTTRLFLKKHAVKEDLEEMEEIIKERKKEL